MVVLRPHSILQHGRGLACEITSFHADYNLLCRLLPKPLHCLRFQSLAPDLERKNMAVATAPLSTPEMSTSAEHEEQPVSTADNEPLTTKQKELVEKTWKFVEGDLQGAGILLFTK